MVSLGRRLPEDMEGSSFLESFLYNKALKKKTVLIDLPLQGFGIWVYRVVSGYDKDRLRIRRRLFVPLKTNKEKEEWAKFSPEAPSEDVEFVGGLRLLVQEWTEKTEDLPDLEEWSNDRARKPEQRFVDEITKGCRLPFSQHTLDLMINEFGLPPSYLHDFVGDYAVPLRLEWVTNDAKCVPGVDPVPSRTTLGLVLQSPKYDLLDHENFISTALSYDPKTKVTSGFLGRISSTTKPGEGTMDIIFDVVSQPRTVVLATHPMMVPTFMLYSCCESYRAHLIQSREHLQTIKDESKELLELLTALAQSRDKHDKAYKQMEKHIISIPTLVYKRSLQNETFPFSQDLGTSCKEALAIVRSLAKKSELLEPKKLGSNAEEKTTELLAQQELEIFVLHLENKLDAYDHRRQRILDRMRTVSKDRDHSMQTLLGFATQISSQAAQKDNAEMRKISFLSMLFLPATAIATIFGMVQFFTVKGGKMSVSPSIIVYWEFALPITIAVFIGWYVASRFRWTRVRKCIIRRICGLEKSESDTNSASENVQRDSRSSTTMGTSTTEYDSLMKKDEETDSEAEERSGCFGIARNSRHFRKAPDVTSEEKPQVNWGDEKNV